MKRIITLLLVILISVSVLVGCVSSGFGIDLISINYCVDGEIYQTKSITRGSTAPYIEAPEKENQIFIGWFTDRALTKKYDFSKNPFLTTTLYAGYALDTVAVADMVASKIMAGVVTVYNKCYNTGLGGLVETSSSTSQGSGVVIDVSDGWCYVLTNYHVVKRLTEYSKQSISVEDAWGNVYEAQVYKNSNKSSIAMDESFDLALLCFQYKEGGKKALSEIELVGDPSINDNIIAVGSPEGQKNTFTCGKIVGINKLPEGSSENGVNIAFDVIVHDANIYRGSSGGPLINAKGQLVGLNFAGYNDGFYGCSIPASKIKEFLNIYVYE